MSAALPALIINLDRSPERLQRIGAAFAAAGIAFERIPGIDGAAMAEAERAAFAAARAAAQPDGWRPGEIGCFLGHSAVWQRIADGDAAWGAVFEDDIRIAADLAVLLASPDWIPAGADVVRLEAFRPMRLAAGARIAGTADRRVYRALSGTAGAAGYILSRRAAQRLLAAPAALHCAVDIMLFKPRRSAMARDLARFQVSPAVCVQHGVADDGAGDSLIRPGRKGRGRAYRERINPLLALWPLRRHAVPFRP